jgi:hypothetical protein
MRLQGVLRRRQTRTNNPTTQAQQYIGTRQECCDGTSRTDGRLPSLRAAPALPSVVSLFRGFDTLPMVAWHSRGSLRTSPAGGWWVAGMAVQRRAVGLRHPLDKCAVSLQGSQYTWCAVAILSCPQF